MIRHICITSCLMLLIVSACSQKKANTLSINNLACEYRTNPLCIDISQPRLGWVLESPKRGQVQTAYRILAASSEELLADDKGDLWDSGTVPSDNSIAVIYNGQQLPMGERIWWKVMAWDRDGNPSDWSAPAWWEMGPQTVEEWQASWIGNSTSAPDRDEEFYTDIPAPLFRKKFDIRGKVFRARLNISGLGYYEAYLNGEKIGKNVLDPGWTEYSKRVYFSTYDVTGMLSDGPAALGIILGNGWYNPLPLRLFGSVNLREEVTIGQPKVTARLQIEYADGTSDTILTDETWTTGDSPILRNNVYLGEKYDARREQQGWNMPGFDDSGWGQAVTVEAPPGKLVAQMQPPIRITRTLVPVRIHEPENGVYIFDMGQNFAGWINFNMRGESGTEVTFRYGELLHPNNTLNDVTTVCCQIKRPGQGGPGAPDYARQEDTYIMKGQGTEVFSQKFGFHGFRYVEVRGLSYEPKLDDMTGLRLSADLDRTGEFACSNAMFNQIHEIIDWTLLSNVFSVESDCPGREKFGYGGDIVTAGETYLYNFDMANFYEKAVRDFHDSARPNGGLTECAPHNGIADQGFGDGTGPVGWTLAHPYLLERLHRFYGDRRLMEDQYETAKRNVAFIRSKHPGHIVHRGISDHGSIDEKPVAATSTAFYYRQAQLIAECAALLRYEDDRLEYEQLAAEIRQAFIDTFIESSTGAVSSFASDLPFWQEKYDPGEDFIVPPRDTFDPPTQASQVIALYYDLLPPSDRNSALDILEQLIIESEGHLSTGIFATDMLFDVLRESGRGEIAYTIADQRTHPGWGWMLENGATTVWEHWHGGDASYNHPMFGSVDEWFFDTLAGIRPADNAEGFDQIIIAPDIVDGLRWVTASYRSIRGRIESNWHRDGNHLVLETIIPVNATATVSIPANSIASVTENGILAASSPGVISAAFSNGIAQFTIGSGHYTFTSLLQD